MNKIKVLMVDDEEQFRITTSKILSKKGYEITMAESGEEALSVLEKTPHDIVILDIKMPGMDGHEALERIKKINSNIQVIMLTGHGHIDSAKGTLEYGAFDYLNKPCDIDLLTSRINDAFVLMHKEPREEKTIKDIMIPIDEYTVIDSESTIKEGVRRLIKSFESPVSTGKLIKTGHRSIIVLDSKNEIVGILSIVDLIMALQPSYLTAAKPSTADSMRYSPMFWSGLFTSQVKMLSECRIGDIMSPPPPGIDEDANMMEMANIFYEQKIRRIAVMSRGKIIGVVREQEVFFEIMNILF